MTAKYGFDYGLFDVLKFDEGPETETFDTAIHARDNNPRLRLLFDDSQYDNCIVEVSQITKDTDGTVGHLTFRLVNTDQTWNMFIWNKTYMGRVINLDLYFSGISGYLRLFTGTIERVSYDGVYVVLLCQDKMIPMLKKKIGGQAPTTAYYATYFNPADLVWCILTDPIYGNLDDRQDSGNSDIDYDSWLAWYQACELAHFQLQAMFAGTFIGNALTKIMQLTNSMFWIDSEGRFQFAMFDPPYTGDESFTVSNSVKIDMDIDKDEICNYMYCYYGYQPAYDIWTSAAAVANHGSIDDFGERSQVEKSREVWHYSYSSAYWFAAQYVYIWKKPRERIKIKSSMLGYLLTLSDTIKVTESLKGITNRPYWIDKIVSIDIQQCTIDFEGIYAGV